MGNLFFFSSSPLSIRRETEKHRRRRRRFRFYKHITTLSLLSLWLLEWKTTDSFFFLYFMTLLCV